MRVPDQTVTCACAGVAPIRTASPMSAAVRRNATAHERRDARAQDFVFGVSSLRVRRFDSLPMIPNNFHLIVLLPFMAHAAASRLHPHHIHRPLRTSALRTPAPRPRQAESDSQFAIRGRSKDTPGAQDSRLLPSTVTTASPVGRREVPSRSESLSEMVCSWVGVAKRIADRVGPASYLLCRQQRPARFFCQRIVPDRASEPQ